MCYDIIIEYVGHTRPVTFELIRSSMEEAEEYMREMERTTLVDVFAITIKETAVENPKRKRILFPYTWEPSYDDVDEDDDRDNEDEEEYEEEEE